MTTSKLRVQVVSDRALHWRKRFRIMASSVHRPKMLTDAEIASEPVGVFAQDARDPQVIIGKHVIETNFRMIFRNKEHLGDEQLFRKRLAEDAQA